MRNNPELSCDAMSPADAGIVCMAELCSYINKMMEILCRKKLLDVPQ